MSEKAWTPAPWVPLAASAVVGTFGSAGAALLSAEPLWAKVAGAGMVGLATSVAAYYGVKSSGSKQKSKGGAEP